MGTYLNRELAELGRDIEKLSADVARHGEAKRNVLAQRIADAERHFEELKRRREAELRAEILMAKARQRQARLTKSVPNCPGCRTALGWCNTTVVVDRGWKSALCNSCYRQGTATKSKSAAPAVLTCVACSRLLFWVTSDIRGVALAPLCNGCLGD